MHRTMVWLFTIALVSIFHHASLTTTNTTLSVYDRTVLADSPVGYWPLNPSVPDDFSGRNLTGVFTNKPTATLMPNNDTVSVFNGINQYFTIKDNEHLEIVKTGILTIEAWLQPKTLQFNQSEGSGYVYWMGKGSARMQSWAARMYSLNNTEERPNRISGYAFNLTGGNGVGSFFQDKVSINEWILYTLTINTVNISSTYPTGYIKIFKNGIKRDQDALVSLAITPENSTAPMRVATQRKKSFFRGAIGKVAVFNYELTPTQLQRHYSCMITNTNCRLNN